MKIEIYDPTKEQASDKFGNFSLFYGKSGVGKSATCLQTAEDPIFHIVAERAMTHSTIKAINRPNIRLKTGIYEGWDDLLSIIYDLRNFNKIRTCLFDSLTHVMNIKLADEVLQESYESMDKSKIDKELTMRVKMSQEGFGTLSKQMARLMTGFEILTANGIDVICTARDTEYPKWNKMLACAPALAGKEFPRDVKGFFDFIGLVETRFDEKGEVVYPPLVSCDDDGSYLSKWTGVKPPGGVIRKQFNVKKMMDVAHGRV